MIILVGASGSGKSTYAQTHFPDYLHCSTDNFLLENGVYVWKAEKLGWAHRQCLEMAQRAVYGGQSVVIDNTNTRARERRDYLRLAEKAGTEVEIHVLPWKPEYMDRNVHGATEETVQRQLSRIDLDLGWIYDSKSNKLREIGNE